MREAAACSGAQVLGTWALLLALWAACGAWFLATPVGRQALVDERVRAVEALGGTVDDATYAGWQARPPYWVYLTSGGRTLLLPVVTVAVAVGIWLWTRRAERGGFLSSVSVAVHASAVLVVQQILATPLHALRESLTSPFNLAALLPFFDEGSLPARFFGTIECFGVWWVVLLAVGCAALTGERVRGFVPRLIGAYVGIAAAVAGAVALAGGS
jgi:hypothetical protein